MVFTSHIFLYYFLPATLAAYFALRRGRNLFLVAASYVFYAWANPWYVLLMFAATVIGYVCGNRIAAAPLEGPSRRGWLTLALVLELSLLGFFKYLGFFEDSLNGLLRAGGGGEVPVWRILLPIGISFYVFHCVSYVMDLYRGTSFRARSLTDFACYIALFPQLVAGPIVRYRTIADEIVQREHSPGKFSRGAALFILGFAKKVLLANQVGSLADAVFLASAPSTADAWFGALAYAFQIYFDFSAYSDMAVGLGRMIGFDFPFNFHSPYQADSITDFWRRWHISLSSFLRDYLYIPLGGNRLGPARTYLNLAIVMLLGGLWHGANWTFVAWGGFHGLMLAAERATSRRSLYPWLPRSLRVLVTFVLIVFSWVLFRSPSFHEAGRMILIMVKLTPAREGSLLLAGEIYQRGSWFVMLLCASLVTVRLEADQWIADLGWRKTAVLGTLWAGCLAILPAQAFNPFLYFQF
jgi:alginate O-acetyltransferase complex protein AlgI